MTSLFQVVLFFLSFSSKTEYQQENKAENFKWYIPIKSTWKPAR